VRTYSPTFTKKQPHKEVSLLDDGKGGRTMILMTRKHTIITGIAFASILVLGACGNSNDENAGDESETTVDTRVTPPTIAAGTQIELGSVESEIQEVSQKCAQVLQPIRDLQKKYQSGLELTDADRPAFNDSLTKGFKECTPDEWDRFQRLELTGWMNAVPSQEAIDAAAEEALNRASEQPTTVAPEVEETPETTIAE